MPPIDHVTGNPAAVLMLDEALYGAPPANIDAYAQQFSALVLSPSAAAYANQAVNSGFGTLSDSALATLVLGHLISPSYLIVTPALQSAVTAAFAANPANRGAVVLQLGQLLDGLVGDATYGLVAAQWRGKIAGDYAGLTYFPGNYSLTTGADTLTGNNSIADTFYGTEATLGAGDKFDGLGGSDWLKVASSGAKAVQFSGFTAVNIEQLQVISDSLGGTGISLAGMPDATLLVNDNSSTDVRFTDVGRIAGLVLLNVSNGSTSVAFAPEAVKGNGDELGLALRNNKTIQGLPVGSVSANGIEVMHISSTSGSSRLAEVASPGSLAMLTLDGDQALDIAKVDFYGAGNVGVVNAAQFNANLSLGLGRQGGADLNFTFAGGLKVDTLLLGGARADYTLIRPDAKVVGDTLLNTHASSPQHGILTLVNVERVQFSDGKLALDLHAGQSGYKAVELLGAVLGANGPADKASAGLLLGYFDTGGSLLSAAQLLLDSGYLAGKAGATPGNSAATTAALVNYVYTNVNGQAALPDTVAALLAPITNHSTTLAQWIADMAASPENIAHVQLTGYAQTGLAYV